MPFYTLSFSSYWKDLFTVETADSSASLSFLPFLITAIAIGVLLAGIYFTLCRGFESSFLRRLKENGADCEENAQTLEKIGYRPGSLKNKATQFLLSSPSCILYKTVSCDVMDAQNLLAESAYGEGAPTETFSSKAEQRNAKKENRAKKRAAVGRLKLKSETKFYILPSRIEYAEKKAGKFSFDDLMNLIYSTVFSIGIWFLLLNLIDPVINWLVG